MFRLFPIFYDSKGVEESGPGQGGEGNENPESGGNGGASSGESSSSSSSEPGTPDYSVGTATTIDNTRKRDVVRGDGDKYIKSKPYKGKPTQNTLGNISQTFGSPPPRSLPRHIHINAGPYYTGSGDVFVRIYINQYVLAEDFNTGSVTADSAFDFVQSIADVTAPNLGAPYHTGSQSQVMNFFGSSSPVGTEQLDTSGSVATTLSIATHQEQTISTNYATNRLIIEYETGVQAIPYHAFIRKIRVTWNSGVTKDFDVLLPGRAQLEFGSFSHSGQYNEARADGCLGDGTSGHVLTSKSDNYITYTGNSHNNYAYVGFFKEVEANGSSPFPNEYYSNTSWNNYRYYDLSFDSNEGPFNFGTQGNQLANYNGEQYYKGIVANLNNGSQIGGVDPVDWFTANIAGNAYDYVVSQLHIPIYQSAPQIFDTTQGFKFSSVHVYSDKTPDCTAVPPSVSFDACLDPTASDYYQITGEDCNSTDLSDVNGVNYLLNPNLASWNTGTCCTDCNGLTLSVVTSGGATNSTSSVSTQNGTDGVIEVTVLDGNGNPTGNGNYYYVIQGANGEIVGGLGSFGSSTIGSGGISNTSFTFGYNVMLAQGSTSVPQITAGVSVNALTGANSNTLVPGTTNTGAFTQGLSPGTYTIFVYDSSTNAAGSSSPCFTSTTWTISNTTGVAGCTDNSSGTNFGVALNYNSNAVLDDGSCQYCHATNGALINSSGNLVPTAGEIATTTPNPFNITPASKTNSNDGEVFIQNISPTSAFQSYINDVVNSSGQQNADFTLRLYKAGTMADFDNAQSSSTPNDLTGFTAQAAAYNNNNGGWNYHYTTTSLGANINYGYFAVKVAISDPDATVEIEECYQVFYFTIPVQACVSIGGNYATALDSSGNQVIISDSRLWYDTPAICNTINSYCCLQPTLSNPSGNCAVNQIIADFYCDPVPSSIDFVLEYDDNGSWVTVNSNSHTPGNSATYSYTYTQGSSTSANTFVDDGYYRVVLTSYYSGNASSTGSAPCTQTSAPIQISTPIYGCMDPNALNYNVGATCPDTCNYCIYGCTDSTAINYNPNATCDDGSCISPYYGCTDPNATNYNPNATIDDGSCIYGVLGCTDTSAYNYNKNCSGQTVVATVDDGCCFYPCNATNQGAPSTYVVGQSTGACVGSNSDGTITVTTSFQTLGIMASQTKNISYYTNAGVLVYSDPTTLSSSTGATWTYSSFSSGLYYYVIIDNFGCTETVSFSVGSSTAGCGCTDPNATNYDSSATTDDGSCIYNGCTDPNASNYDPNAAADDGSCVYPSAINPCIPENTNSLIFLLEACLAKNGFQYYNKLVTGQADDCSIMNAWKIILIEYLVAKRGNLCIYNCADSGTPAASTINTCDDDWIQGGPVTGVNDQAYAGSSIATGEGTTITDASLYFVQANQLFQGDVIKMPSGNIYRVVKQGGCTYGCYSPETAQGAKAGHWEQCVSGLQVTSFNDSVNYLDKFNTFVTKFCVDCDIVDENVIKNVRSTTPSRRGQSSGISIDGISGLEI